MDSFSCKTRLFAGTGARSALGQWHSRRLFLVADPYFVRNGMAKGVAAAAGAEAMACFSPGEPVPTVTMAMEGVGRLHGFQPDLVVALGGGSTLDLAKATVFFSKTIAPLVAIPTTSGTGAEVTDSVILTHNRVRRRLTDPRLLPAGAILDDEYLKSLPKPLIAGGGFDVLTHALEACAARNAGAMTDLLAREAFHLAYAYLPASFNGRQDVRLSVHRASTLAALACSQSGLGLCHALSHALEDGFPLPHGVLNAMLLPPVIACNARAVGHKYAELARCAGISGSTNTLAVRNLCSGLVRLREALAIPHTLTQAGISRRQLWRCTGEIVAATLSDPCCLTNPIAVDDFLVRRLLEEITGHE